MRETVRGEEIGYDRIVYVESQTRHGDCKAATALSALATSTIKLGTGVTNSFTRHPASMSVGIAKAKPESGGTAYLSTCQWRRYFDQPCKASKIAELN